MYKTNFHLYKRLDNNVHRKKGFLCYTLPVRLGAKMWKIEIEAVVKSILFNVGINVVVILYDFWAYDVERRTSGCN